MKSSFWRQEHWTTLDIFLLHKHMHSRNIRKVSFDIPHFFQVILQAIHLMSIMGNNGTFNKPLRQIFQDMELVVHVLYLILCISGLFGHPFFFSFTLFDVINRYLPNLYKVNLYENWHFCLNLTFSGKKLCSMSWNPSPRTWGPSS